MTVLWSAGPDGLQYVQTAQGYLPLRNPNGETLLGPVYTILYVYITVYSWQSRLSILLYRDKTVRQGDRVRDLQSDMTELHSDITAKLLDTI